MFIKLKKKLTCGFLAHFSSKSFFALSRKSWTIFVFCAQGFGYVMVVVVHETENETIIRVARDNLLCWGFSISPQILPWQSQEIP